eukprot:7268196-Prymnesium_polylepis.1
MTKASQPEGRFELRQTQKPKMESRGVSTRGLKPIRRCCGMLKAKMVSRGLANRRRLDSEMR